MVIARLGTDWWARAAWPKAVVLSVGLVCIAACVITWLRSNRHL